MELLRRFASGEDVARSPEDALQMAAVARRDRRAILSARLYREALERELAGRPGPAHCYSAACAAVLAACGREGEGAGLTEGARAEWRRLALGWLRAELERSAKRLSDGTSAGKGVLEHLERWLADPDLAGVRPPGRLEGFREGETREWRALWRDPGTLVERARTAADTKEGGK